MSLSSDDIFHVFAALAALLVVAHVGGLVAARLRLPPMVGELVGGLLLGATALQRVWPAGFDWLFPPPAADGTAPPVLPILSFCSHLGLLLLMYIGGLGMRRLLTRADVRAVAWISSLGVLIPAGVGLLILRVDDFSRYAGRAASLPALHLVLVAALAVTSIPVITRIFLDLGLMETRLARVVLSVAVFEDALLYIGLSLAVGMASASAKHDASIPARLGMDPSGVAYVLWHVSASVLLLAAASLGVRLLASRRSGEGTLNPIARRSPLGWTIALVFAVTLVAMLLGLAPIFGALVAGIAASDDARPAFVNARRQIEGFAMATFVPIYFALIGVSLDLVDALDLRFTIGLLAVGTVVKYAASLLGARIAGESAPMAQALAVSVNARGGPGIVLATTAFDAGIVDERAFTALVVLALVTSVAAGGWLARMLRRAPDASRVLREDRADDAATGGKGQVDRPVTVAPGVAGILSE